GNRPLFGDEDILIGSVFLEGTVSEDLNGRVALGQGEYALGYVGSISVADNGDLAGTGTLDAYLPADNGLNTLVGVDSLGLGDIEASAELQFDGLRRISLTGIEGGSG